MKRGVGKVPPVSDTTPHREGVVGLCPASGWRDEAGQVLGVGVLETLTKPYPSAPPSPPQRALSDLQAGEGARSSGMASPLAW